MASALTLETMSPGLLKGVERAQREPEGRFHALAPLIDMPALERLPAATTSRRRSSAGRTRVAPLYHRRRDGGRVAGRGCWSTLSGRR
jgi:plasmid stabilization system protein ParE